MARKSRKSFGIAENKDITKSLVKKEEYMATAAYARLSSFNSGHETNDTMENQTALLLEFIRNHPELKLSEVYTDNGYSGTDFDRPEFMRLMDDVRTGKIQCIVVKDLSRFGRNYLEMGYYIETLFPRLNIRFIAVTDDFDSYRPEDRESLSVPIKNMVNAMYAKELSKKMVIAAAMRRQNPDKLPNGSVPFGYIENEEKSKYLSHPEIAPYVRMIFHWKLMGVGPTEIAKRLTLLGVVTPGQYKKAKGNIETVRPEKWDISMVQHILKTPTFTGEVCLGRYRTALYKNEPQRKVPENEWVVRENAHEPLVTHEDYQKIQEMQSNHYTMIGRKNALNVRERGRLQAELPAIIYCAECNKKMFFGRYMHHYASSEKSVTFYECKKEKGQAKCGGQMVYTDFLKAVIMDQIRFLSKEICDRKELLEQMKGSEQNNKLLSLKKKIVAYEKKVEDEGERLEHLYENHAEGLVDIEDYNYLKERYIHNKQETEKFLQELKLEERLINTLIRKYEEMANNLEQYICVTEFEPALIEQLVERVLVSPSGRIEIVFKYADVFQRITELMEVGDDSILFEVVNS